MGALAYAHMRARHKLSRLLHRTDQPEPHTSVRDQNSGCETV
jgi:hypothetical protein